MDRMAQWAVTIPADQWATERLYHNETVTLPGSAGAVAPDEEVLLLADAQVVALTRAAKTDGDDLVLAYLLRAFDAPLPAPALSAPDSAVSESAASGSAALGSTPPDLSAAGTPVEVAPDEFRRLTAALSQVAGEPGPGTPTWLVSLALPIEAATQADAVRQFWTHVAELGPKELPTYVWPSGDELAMQAFVLGEEANQDPEEEDDED
jgi:hypothetical protein